MTGPALEQAADRPPLNILIAVPTNGRVHSAFAYDLAQLMGAAGGTLIARDIAEVHLSLSEGTLIQAQRSDLVRNAIARHCTHILWLDSDMRFPVDLLHRFLSHRVPFVAANYSTRRLPEIQPTAYKSLLSRERLFTTETSTGLEEAEAVGFGAALVSVDLYRRLSQPWYDIPWSEDIKGWVGEDIYFCRRVREELGEKILIDHDISKYVAHCGEMEFRPLHAVAYRDAQAARLVEV